MPVTQDREQAKQSSNVDYHVHTEYSTDCFVRVEDVVDTAIRRGLREIAVTDHNTIAGALKAREYSQGRPVRVIVGAEIDTDCGEVIGLDLEEQIREHRLEAVIDEIKRQGGRLLIPHPFGRMRRKRLKVPLAQIADKVDLIEVYNGRNIAGHGNRLARLFAAKHGITAVGGSDAHFAFEIGNTGQSKINWRGFLGYFLTAALKRFRLVVSRPKKR